MSTQPAEPMDKLAKFIAGTRYEDVPEAVIDFVKRDILDAFAITLGVPMKKAAGK